MKRFPSDEKDKFMVRMPFGMREQIAQAADLAGRSMNAEIVHRLERSLRPGPVRSDEPPEMPPPSEGEMDERDASIQWVPGSMELLLQRWATYRSWLSSMKRDLALLQSGPYSSVTEQAAADLRDEMAMAYQMLLEIEANPLFPADMPRTPKTE